MWHICGRVAYRVLLESQKERNNLQVVIWFGARDNIKMDRKYGVGLGLD